MKRIRGRRMEIDAIDSQLLKLLAERMKLAAEIGKRKAELKMPVIDSQREEAIQQAWKAEAEKLGLDAAQTEKILCAVLEMSRAKQAKSIQAGGEREHKAKVAIQGERGAFSELMAQKMFHDCKILPCRTFKEVFASVQSGRADAGVVPVENSSTGKIKETNKLLPSSDLEISEAGVLKIPHCLIAQKGASLASLERIYAHPEAIAQCQRFLGELGNKRRCKIIPWYDGAGAAGMVETDKRAGLIASARTARLHGLEILKRGIQDSKDNATRFVSISKKKKSLGIIGFGRFGQLAAKHLKNHFEVFASDSENKQTEAEEVGVKFTNIIDCAEKDFILLCVPISQMEDTLLKIAPHVKNGALVADVCSVKEKPVELMSKILPEKCECVGTHPLFGPDTAKNGLAGKKIAICQIRCKRLNNVKEFLQGLGLTVITTTPAEHDRQMANSLLLIHLLGKALIRSGVERNELSTPTHERLMELVDIVRNDSEELFIDMNKRNRFAPEIRKKLVRELIEINGELNDA